MRFIKLTSKTTEKVFTFGIGDAHIAIYEDSTGTVFSVGGLVEYKVKESPAEILAMIGEEDKTRLGNLIAWEKAVLPRLHTFYEMCVSAEMTNTAGIVSKLIQEAP